MNQKTDLTPDDEAVGRDSLYAKAFDHEICGRKLGDVLYSELPGLEAKCKRMRRLARETIKHARAMKTPIKNAQE